MGKSIIVKNVYITQKEERKLNIVKYIGCKRKMQKGHVEYAIKIKEINL